MTEDNRPLRHHAHDCDCARCLLRHIARDTHRILRTLNPIHHLEITIMPKTIAVGATATVFLTAVGTDGKPWVFSPADVIALSAAVPGDVSFAPPVIAADGSSVTVVVTGVAADAGDAITATVDGVTSNPDMLTVGAPASKIASVTLALQ
jgi:hypothetical protein